MKALESHLGGRDAVLSPHATSAGNLPAIDAITDRLVGHLQELGNLADREPLWFWFEGVQVTQGSEECPLRCWTEGERQVGHSLSFHASYVHLLYRGLYLYMGQMSIDTSGW
jgi:hypothetical protein